MRCYTPVAPGDERMTDTLTAVLHRIRTGTATDADADRVDAMIRLAHDWGWRNGGVPRDNSRAGLLAWLDRESGQ